MFRTFGYRYVLDASAAVVREQLQNPIQRMPIRNGIMWRIPDAIPPGNIVAIMHTPESTRTRPGRHAHQQLHRHPRLVTKEVIPTSAMPAAVITIPTRLGPGRGTG